MNSILMLKAELKKGSNMKYEVPDVYSHDSILTIEARANPSEVAKMLLGVAFNEQDPIYAFNLIEKYIYSENETLVSTALECLGHLIRIQHYAPKERLRKIYEKCDSSENEDVQWGLEIFLDDLKVFAPEIAEEIINERKGRTQM
jgi:hypothetical protein